MSNEAKEKSSDVSGKVDALVRWVFFTMVEISTGWMRVGNAYASREDAEGWLDFVSASKGGRPARVEGLDLFYVDGQLDERTVRELDERFNLDAQNS